MAVTGRVPGAEAEGAAGLALRVALVPPQFLVGFGLSLPPKVELTTRERKARSL